MPDASPAISQILPCWFPKLGLPLFLAPLIMAAMRNYTGGSVLPCSIALSAPPSNGATKKEGPLFCLALLHYPPHPCKKSVAEFSLSPYAFATFHLLDNPYIQICPLHYYCLKRTLTWKLTGFLPVNIEDSMHFRETATKLLWNRRLATPQKK